MIKKLFTLLVVALAGFAIIVSMQPDDFRITRSLPMNVPAAAVFAHVNDVKQWDAWSPWAKLDPKATMSFEGPAAGVGAITKWSGNNDVGEGSQTIIESRPPEFIKFKLDLVRPMEAHNNVEFTFKPTGNQTVVTWSMYGKNNFIGKAFSLILNCDKMVGGQFEKGLASLKAVVEK